MNEPPETGESVEPSAVSVTAEADLDIRGDCDRCDGWHPEGECPAEQPQPHRKGTSGRLDVNGVEWWACDPYPTWYRHVDGVLHTGRGDQIGGVHEWPAPWADGGADSDG